MNRRNFLITSTIAACSVPLITFSSEQLPKKYHKITKDWSISCGSVINWNDFNVYSKIGLSNDKDSFFREMDNDSEYVLRCQDAPYIYVNKDRCYKIANYKGDWIDNDCHLFEVEFDIVEYLGPTPTERIIIISGFDYCIYALGKDYYKEVKNNFTPFKIRKGWTLDRHEVYRPLTEEMHSKIKYFDFNKQTYKEYLQKYNTKLKELNLI